MTIASLLALWGSPMVRRAAGLAGMLGLIAGVWFAAPRLTHVALEAIREPARQEVRNDLAAQLAEAKTQHTLDQASLNETVARLADSAAANRDLLRKAHASSYAQIHRAVTEGRDPAVEWAAYFDKLCGEAQTGPCVADGRAAGDDPAGAARGNADPAAPGAQPAEIDTACADLAGCARAVQALKSDRVALLDHDEALVTALVQANADKRTIVAIADAANAANAKGPPT